MKLVRWSRALTLLWLTAFFASAQADDVQMRSGEACEGLSDAACCVQTVQIHAFRASGDQLPRRAEVVAKLACQAKDKQVATHACRQLLMARGVDVATASDQCKQDAVVARCRAEPSCMACARDVGDLGFRRVAGLCWAAVHRARK